MLAPHPGAYHPPVRFPLAAGFGLGLVLTSASACSGSTSHAAAAAHESGQDVCASPALASVTSGKTLGASGLITTLSAERAIGNVSPTQWKHLKGSTKITMCVFDALSSRASESLIDCPPSQEDYDSSLTSRTYLVAPDGKLRRGSWIGP